MSSPLVEAASDDPIALLRHYRSLCEASGLARAHRLTLAAPVADELAALEARLVQILGTAVQRPAAGRVASSAGPIVVREPELTVTGGGSQSDQSGTATVYTDGSAEGNPGPGGYCALVRIPGRPDRELSGGTNHTTNNKMELMAAIVGVGAAFDAGFKQVTVISDSEYLVKGMTRWLAGWLTKGWKTSDGQPVKNRELWEQLDKLAGLGTIQWQWIRGHAGHPENERCDVVATAAARKAAQGSR